MILKTCLKSLITRNKRKKAFQLMHKHIVEADNPDLKNQLIQLEAQLNELNSQRRMSTISRPEENLSLNRINLALIELIDELPSEIAEKKINIARCNLIHLFGVRPLIYMIIIISVFFILTRNVKEFDAEISLMVDKVSFNMIHGDQLFHNLNLKEFQISNFSKIMFPAEEAFLDENMDSVYEKKVELLKNSLTILPNAEIGGSDFVTTPASLIGISGLQEANIALQVNREIENELVLAITHSDNLKIDLKLDMETYFSGTYVDINGWDYENKVEYVAGKINNSKHKNAQIVGDSALCLVNLQIEESERPNINDIAIQDISFLKRESGKVVSSILNGSIQITGFDKTLLNEAELLKIEETNHLYISKITINPSDIQILLKGSFKQVLIGRDGKPINPMLITWLLKNHPITFTSAILCLILLMYIAIPKNKFG